MWFKDPNLKIVGLAFNHSAQWLVCVTQDLTVFVLNVYFMVVHDNMSHPLKVIQTTRYAREKKTNFADVKCWRSGAGVEYAIITTTPGNVRLVHLASGDYIKVKAKTSLGKFHILSEPGGAESRPSSWLLIETPGQGFYRLLIGHYLDSGKYEDLASPGAAQKQEFQFYSVSVSKSGNVQLSVQQTARGPMVLIFDPETKQLQVHDSNLRLLFRYNVHTQAEVKSVHITENLIFALTSPSPHHGHQQQQHQQHQHDTLHGAPNNTNANKILVFSRIFSEEKQPPTPIMPYQEFTLPASEHVRSGFLQGFPRLIASTTGSSSPISSSTSSSSSSNTSSSSTSSTADVNGSGSDSSSGGVAIGAQSGSGKMHTSKARPRSVRSFVEVSPMSLFLTAQGGVNSGSSSSSSSSTSTSASSSTSANSTNGSGAAPGTQKDMFSYARVRASAAASSSSSSSTSASADPSTSGFGEKRSLPMYLDERGELEYEESFVDESRVDGVFFWTEEGLYELRSTVSPEELFFRFIERVEKKQGEALGLTFALDVCKLYELSADEHFRRGQLGDAHGLYHLSNVSTPKLIRQWLSVGRMDEPISTLRVMLMGAKVGEARRPLIANELIRCHIQRLLNPSKKSNLRKLLNVNERCRDEELEVFLKNNPDFDEAEMRQLFDSFGLIRFDLIVAQAKRHLKVTLDSLAAQRGISYLSMEHVRFLSENNAIESGTLKVEDANTLLAHFPLHIQLLHYLTAVSNIQNTLPRIQDLLNDLDDEALAQVCRFFDPQGPFVGPMLHSHDHSQQQQQQQQQSQTNASPSKRRGQDSMVDVSSSSIGSPLDTHSSSSSSSTHQSGAKSRGQQFMDARQFVSQCVELFLIALIRLNRGSESLPQSWNHSHISSSSSSSSPSSSLPSVSTHLPGDSVIGSTRLSFSSSFLSSSPSLVPVGSSLNTSMALNASNASATNTDDQAVSSPSSSASIVHPSLAAALSLESVVEQASTLSPRRPAQLEASLERKGAQRGLKTLKAVSVFCGFHHTALLTENGQVFTWGAGSKGQLGHENVSDTLWVPKPVAGLSLASIGERVWKVACGGNHSLALTQSGQIYSFGSNARGQLGLADRADRTEPKQVIFDENLRHQMGAIIDISAGFWHSVLVSERGVWTAGANSSQAATALHSELGDQLSFTQLSNLPTDSFTMVRCGFGHTALLTKRGRVYTFGNNEYGQLGLGHNNPVDAPQQVRGLLDDKHIIDIACGSFSTFGVSEVYSVYAWGQGAKNRLGVIRGSSSSSSTNIASNGNNTNTNSAFTNSNDSEFEEMSPMRIDALQGLEINRIFAGPSHAFATSSTGKVYVWGDCETPMKSKANDPRLPAALSRWSDSPIISIGCGDDFSVCVLENGFVYTFGKGMCGQLGLNDEHDHWEAKQAFLNTSLVVEDTSINDLTMPPKSPPLNNSSTSNTTMQHAGEKLASLSNPHATPTPSSGQPSASESSSSSTTAATAHSDQESRETTPSTLRKGDLTRSSSILNASSSVSTYSDPMLLEHSLIALTKRYRPSAILLQCFILDNLSAASLVLEQCGAWAASIDCKIRILQREFQKMEVVNGGGSSEAGGTLSSFDIAQQTHLLTELLKDLAQPHVPHHARQEGLKHVLQMWKKVGASTATLEALLRGSSLVVALASLLQDASDPSSSHDNVNVGIDNSSGKGNKMQFFGLDFSPKFMLRVVQAGLEEQRRNANHNLTASRRTASMEPNGGAKSVVSLNLSHGISSRPNASSTSPNGSSMASVPISKDVAWIERRNNLEKDIKLRTKIQISQPALEDFIQHSMSSSSTSSPFSSGNVADPDVTFTCGHTYSGRRFSQSTIPLFRDKMAKFPVQLPLTVKLLLMDFQSAISHTACPPCVYNHLKEKHAPSLDRWNPQ